MWTKTDESTHKLEQDEKGGGGVSMPTKMRENLLTHRLEMSRQRGL